MKKLGTLSQSKHGLAGSSKMDGTMVTVGQSKVQGAKQATVQFHVVECWRRPSKPPRCPAVVSYPTPKSNANARMQCS